MKKFTQIRYFTKIIPTINGTFTIRQDLGWKPTFENCPTLQEYLDFLKANAAQIRYENGLDSIQSSNECDIY